MTTKFQVAVVTVLEVQAVDEKDAANVAEAALWRSLVGAHDATTLEGDLLLRWRRKDHDYEVRVTRPPLELSRALRSGSHVRVEAM